MTAGNPSGPRRLRDVLQKVVARLGLERDVEDYRLWQAWDEVVGPDVARNAQPAALNGRRLVVTVRNNVWMQELSLLREELCRRLNQWMGRHVVSEIFLVVGRLEPPTNQSARQRRPALGPAASPAPATQRPCRDLDEAVARLWRAASERNREGN